MSKNDPHCVLECTDKVAQVIDPNRPIQLSVASHSGEVSFDGAFLSIYTSVNE
ncbi:hypothetical protein FACS1894208_11270 [Clostridia bacterium]|nr:hypothetical protein FACS1894208_11270 [Clostridia bacterium]